MKPRRMRNLVWVAAAAFGIVCAVVWVSSRPVEYLDGVPISKWVQERNERVLLRIGPKAVPYLARNLGAKDSLVAKTKGKLWPHLPASVKRFLNPPVSAHTLRDSAAYGLLILGRHATSAVPHLVQMARSDSDQHFQSFAATALLRIAPEKPLAQVEITRLLQRGNADTFNSLTLALEYAKERGRFAVPLLIDKLAADQTSEIEPGRFGRMAITGFRGIGPGAQEAVPGLLPFLRGSHAPRVLEALIAIAPTNQSVIPALEEAFQRDPKLRAPVMQVLVAMGEQARGAAPLLRASLSHTNGLVRVLSAFALGKLEKNWESTLPVLISELATTKQVSEHEYWRVELHAGFGTHVFGPRTAAAHFLGEIGDDARAAVPSLAKAAQEERALFRRIWPAHALWKTEKSAAAVAPLIEVLAQKNVSATMTVIACRMLAEMGTNATLAVPHLLNFATNTPFSGSITPALVHEEVVAALRKIQPDVLRQVPVR